MSWFNSGCSGSGFSRLTFDDPKAQALASVQTLFSYNKPLSFTNLPPTEKMSILDVTASASAALVTRPMLSVTSPVPLTRVNGCIEPPNQRRYGKNGCYGSQRYFEEVTQRNAVAITGRTGVGSIALGVRVYDVLRILGTLFVGAMGESTLQVLQLGSRC